MKLSAVMLVGGLLTCLLTSCDNAPATTQPTHQPDNSQANATRIRSATVAPPDSPTVVPIDTAAPAVDGAITLASAGIIFPDSAPAWSPDGSTIAFVLSAPRANKDNTEPIIKLTIVAADGRLIAQTDLDRASGQQSITDLLWSPDSHYILGLAPANLPTAFMFSADGKLIAQIPRPNLRSRVVFTPTWLPDSSGILIDVAENTAGIVSPDGKTTRKLGSIKEPVRSAAYGLSKDGKHFFASSFLKAVLYGIDLTTGEVTDLFQDKTFKGVDKDNTDARVALTPDASWFAAAFSKPNFGGNALYFFDAAAKEVAEVDIPGNPLSIAAAPQGNTLAVSIPPSKTGESYTLRFYDPTGKVLGESKIFSDFAWLPDGTGVLAADDQSILAVFDVNGNKRFAYQGWNLVFNGPNASLPLFTLSPDGQYLTLAERAYITTTKGDGSVEAPSAVQVLDMQGKLVRKIDGNNTPRIAWSPDSTTIVLPVIKQGIQAIKIK